jgi:hypothetical protein
MSADGSQPIRQPRASNKPRNTVMLRLEEVGHRKGFFAADHVSAAKLKQRAFRLGQTVSVEIRVPRDPTQWRRAHALGDFLIQNTDEFANYTDAHHVLKRLQLEGNIECDSIAIRGDFGLLEHRVPRSLAFENMDQIVFNRVYAEFCKLIQRKYVEGFDDAMMLEFEKFAGSAG